MPLPRNCFVRRTYEKASCSRNPLDFMRKDISFADFSSSSRCALGRMMCVGACVCMFAVCVCRRKLTYASNLVFSIVFLACKTKSGLTCLVCSLYGVHCTLRLDSRHTYGNDD